MALLLVLFVVLLLGFSLSALVRRSTGLALSARARERELQDRWARLSVRRALLDGFPRYLEEALLELRQHARDDSRTGRESARDPWDLATRRGSIALGQVTIDFVVSSENAKISAESWLERYGESALAALLSEWPRGRDISPRRPALLHREIESQPLLTRRLTHLAQIAQFDGTDWAFDGREDLTHVVTVFGSGASHWSFLRPEALEEVLRKGVERPTREKLLELRGTEPLLSLQDAVRLTPLSVSERLFFARFLSERLDTTSIWLRSRKGARDDVELIVGGPYAGGLTPPQVFSWSPAR